MSQHGQTPDTGALSSALVLTINSRGFWIPPYGDINPLSLDYPSLCLLSRLATINGQQNVSAAVEHVSEQLGDLADPDALQKFVSALETRQLLRSAQTAAAPHAARPEKSTPGPVEALDEVLVAELPVQVWMQGPEFEIRGHDGRVRARLNAEELMALAAFNKPMSTQDSWTSHCQTCGPYALEYKTFLGLLARLRGSDLLRRFEGGAKDPLNQKHDNAALLGDHAKRVESAIDAGVKAHEAAERERVAAGGEPRIRVVPVMAYWLIPPLALGMLVSAARAHDGGRLRKHYHFVPDWQARWHRLEPYTQDDGVYLFSNYLWSHHGNLHFSRRIKAANPRSVTIHGGPDTPRYARDLENYMRDNPHIDVIVHGEGEVTLCHILDVLADSFGEEGPDLSRLKNVPGLTYRDGERLVSTAPRAQLKELDSVPSPYLEGLFQAYEGTVSSVTIETNRGCPYGCTFCDWGAATMSKVRKFDLDRVFAELEWCARHGVKSVGLADANYGMFERDVLIAEKVVELKRKYGYPRAFGSNYAKNKIKYLAKIVSSLKEAGIITQGLLALQSLDENTLSVIKRSNIKTDKYDELAAEFRKAGLPLVVDIMMGLPGSTLESYKSDLQGCIDREVNANVYPTQVLINSPMNDPAYRQEHGIVTDTPGSTDDYTVTESQLSPLKDIVVACNTFTREDHAQMQLLRIMYYLFENFGILRQFSRFVRQEAGVREIDFYHFLANEVLQDPEAWPSLAVTVKVVSKEMIPPGDWHTFIDEIGRFVISHYGLADDAALRTALDVQHALLPARDRVFPCRLSLPHDYVAWHQAMTEAKDAGQREQWERVVPRLCEFSAGEFEVTDPNEVCEWTLGSGIDFNFLGDWEFSSPVSRVLAARHLQLKEESG